MDVKSSPTAQHTGTGEWGEEQKFWLILKSEVEIFDGCSAHSGFLGSREPRPSEAACVNTPGELVPDWFHAVAYLCA